MRLNSFFVFPTATVFFGLLFFLACNTQDRGGIQPSPQTIKPMPEGVVLVERGRAQAVVVTADVPSRMAAYAARELVAHVKKATSVELLIVKESAVPDSFPHRVYIGDTQAARCHGIKPDELAFDVSILHTAGADLYILGREIPAAFWGTGKNAERSGDPLAVVGEEPLRKPTGSGTLFGVYELLERTLGVRWIWPGDLGTYVPRTDTLRIPVLDLTVKPLLGVRLFGWNRTASLGTPQPGSFSSEETWVSFRDAQRIYERRHRQGVSAQTFFPGHFFQWWWTYFGDEHPEWFMMDANGQRGKWDEKNKEDKTKMPFKEVQYRARALCVSNPELPQFIVANNWDALWAKNIPGPWYSKYYKALFGKGKDCIDLSECDDLKSCCCPDCKAMDEPQPQGLDLSDYWGMPVTSDRYAKFWKRVYDLGVTRNPNLKITVFLYWPTFHAPLGDIRLNNNFIGEFAPWTGRMMWMPMPDKSLRNMERQWLGWKRTGMTMRFRPNYMYGCNVLPFFSIRQAGEFFKFTVRNGSQGANFDSLFGHYGVQALSLYMHMRLMANPDLEIDAIRGEFCSAFGPAAKAIDRYFRYWEDYSENIVNGSGEIYPQWGPRQYYLAAQLYTPAVFNSAEGILREALTMARQSPEPEFAERVEFLQAGLEHARLFACVLGTLHWNGTKLSPSLTNRAEFEVAQKAYVDLLAFRRAHEQMPIVDLKHTAGLEAMWLGNLANLAKDFDEIKQAAPRAATSPWSNWQFHKDPGDQGVAQQWFRPDAELKDWMPIKVPAFWDASIGQYIGYGWYRTTFAVPGGWKGQPLALEFGGVDEQAWVYVNGMLVGEHTARSSGLAVGTLWNKPFTIAVNPQCLRYGTENTLVVRVHNSAFAGGIHKPVVGYAPHPEQWRPLPNR